MSGLDRYAKAIVAAILAALGVMYKALLDERLSGVESVLIASAFFGNLLLVWAVPNAPKALLAPKAGDDPDGFDMMPPGARSNAGI